MAISWLKKIFGQSETPAPEQQETQSPEPEFYEDDSTTEAPAEQEAAEDVESDDTTVENTEDAEAAQGADTEADDVEAVASHAESQAAEEAPAADAVPAQEVAATEATNSAEATVTEAVAGVETASAAEVVEVTDAESEPAQAEVAAEPAAEPVVQEKKGFFSRLVSGLSRTSATIGAGITSIFVGKKISKELFIELEEKLLMSDVGITATDKIINNLNQHVKLADLKDSEAVLKQLKVELKNIVAPCSEPLEVKEHTPFLILMVGVNGVGKTTTIGKLTKKLQAEGKSVLLAAGDTFRAAAIEQLQEWGNRNNVPVIAQKPNSDSAAVIYDAFNSAKAKGIDVVIADTAGRLQNKSHLLEELKKIVRVVQKLDPNAPHEVLITLDATTGQNALSQVELFDQAVNVTGIALTKLDGTAKGGVIFAICDRFKKPVRFIGVGEKIDDLQPFNADNFIEALFESKE